MTYHTLQHTTTHCNTLQHTVAQEHEASLIQVLSKSYPGLIQVLSRSYPSLIQAAGGGRTEEVQRQLGAGTNVNCRQDGVSVPEWIWYMNIDLKSLFEQVFIDRVHTLIVWTLSSLSTAFSSSLSYLPPPLCLIFLYPCLSFALSLPPILCLSLPLSSVLSLFPQGTRGDSTTRCNLLQHTLTHCISLQCTVPHCITLYYTATHVCIYTYMCVCECVCEYARVYMYFCRYTYIYGQIHKLVFMLVNGMHALSHEACTSYASVMAHIWMSHGAHMNESTPMHVIGHVSEWVRSYIYTYTCIYIYVWVCT